MRVRTRRRILRMRERRGIRKRGIRSKEK